MNRFLYAEANPWTLVDPSGHWAHNLDRGVGEEGAYLAQDLEETRAYAALARTSKQGVYWKHSARAAHTYVAHARQIEATGNPLLIGAAIFAPVLVAIAWEAALPVAAAIESAAVTAAASAADTVITALTIGRAAGPVAACAAVNCAEKAQTAAAAACEFYGPCAPGSGPSTFGGGSGGTKLYRGMMEADDALPMTGPTARQLGARPGPGSNTDIPVGPNGQVLPGTGGMSVAPDSAQSLPPFRRPPSLGGTSKDPVWCIDTCDLPPELTYAQDSQFHGTIQPSSAMSFEEYQDALSSTRSFWTRVTQ